MACTLSEAPSTSGGNHWFPGSAASVSELLDIPEQVFLPKRAVEQVGWEGALPGALLAGRAALAGKWQSCWGQCFHGVQPLLWDRPCNFIPRLILNIMNKGVGTLECSVPLKLLLCRNAFLVKQSHSAYDSVTRSQRWEVVSQACCDAPFEGAHGLRERRLFRQLV